MVIGLADLAPAGSFAGELLFCVGELLVGVTEKNEAEDGDGIFGGFQLRIGAELVGRVPESLLNLVVVVWHKFLRCADLTTAYLSKKPQPVEWFGG